MDLYIMDNELNTVEVYDSYISLLWTERYNELGDFEVVARANDQNRNKFYTGRYLAIKDSKRIMIIESVLDSESEDGEKTLSIKGRSYESILDSRMVSVGTDYVYHGDKFVNMAKNPGFVVLQDQILGKYPGRGGSAELSIVPEPDSKSGYGVKVAPVSNSTNSTSYYALVTSPLDEWYGKRIIVSAWIRVLKVQTGTVGGVEKPRSIHVSLARPDGSVNWGLYMSASAPNTVGRHYLTLVVDLPEPNGEYDKFNIRLFNGSRTVGQDVVWSDLIITRGVPSKPFAYFDGSYSPHPDYTPSWRNEEWLSESELKHDGGLPKIKTPELLPQELAEWLVDTYAVQGEIKPGDAMPNIEFDNIYPPDTNPMPDTPITLYLEPKSLLDSVYDIAQEYELGVRMVRCPHCKNMKFGLYSGSDLSESVLFSKDLENFTDPSTYTTTEGLYNVAYVYSKYGVKEVYAQGHTPDTAVGTNRRVLMVDASDQVDENSNISDKLELAGERALNKASRSKFVDGKVPPKINYKYDEDYHVGDLVMVSGPDGTRQKMRITEYIFVSDEEGVRSYPTLTEEETLSSGTWLSPEWNIDWNQVPNTSEFEWGSI